MAISYALSRNDIFDIKLILTATFNTTGRGQLVAKFLDYANRTDVDIGIGLETPADNQNGGVGPQMPWAADYDLTKYTGKIYQDGISRAKEILQTGTKQNPIYLVEIAPVPNLGVLFTNNPELKANMRLITMAGSVYKGYGSSYQEREYNVVKNLSASQIVYNYTDKTPYAYPICTAPLDTTYFFQIYGNNYQTILNSKEPIPTTLVENYQVWYDNGGKNFGAYRPFSPTTATSCMYDAQAMFQASMLAMNSTDTQQAQCDTMPFMEMQGLKIIVNDTGFTVNDTMPNNNIEMNYEAINYNGGEHNGSYPLGEYIANTLANPK